jgi:hypothetical protein
VTEGRVTGLYAVALVPVGGLALAISGWVMDLSANQAPGLPSGVDGWALNIVPAFAFGLIGYFALVRFIGAGYAGDHWLRGHAWRTAALYLVVFGLGVLLLHDGCSQDFWRLGQLVLWLWLAAVAGIVADGLAVLHGRRLAPTIA